MSKLDKIPSTTQLKIGISQCLLGDNVRYDGGDKYLAFAMQQLKPYADYVAICPEVAIGLSVPRPTIGLYQLDDKSIILRFNERQVVDTIDSDMQQFCQRTIANLVDLAGYIVCAKSPSCGLDNAKVYTNDEHHFVRYADGKFTAYLRHTYPWLPIEDNIALMDRDIQQHYMVRIFALHRLNQLKKSGLTRHALLTFHSRYKYLLLAHSQPLYREIGPFVAKLGTDNNLTDFFEQYRTKLMALLAIPATTQNHTNVLMHIQGYFNRCVNHQQKQELTNVILAYRHGEVPLSEPIVYLKQYLAAYPNEYLSQQYYFEHYPHTLAI